MGHQNYDIKKLTELAESSAEVIKEKATDDVFHFLNVFNIKNGKFEISKELLYSIYAKWSKEPVIQSKFSKFVAKFFKNDSKRFYISIDALQITQTVYETLKKQKQQTIKVKNYKRHFDAFIESVGLIKGKDFLPSACFYYYYDIWRYKNKSKTNLSYKQFNDFIVLFFDRKKVLENKKPKTFIGIDRSSLKIQLTDNKIKFASEWTERVYGKKENNKKS